MNQESDIYFKYCPYFAKPMDNIESDLFEKKLERVPETIRDLIFDAKTTELIHNRVVSSQLTEAQGKDFSAIIRDVLIGNKYIGDMVALTKEKLAIDEVKARELVNELIEKVFMPFLDDIKKVQTLAQRRPVETPMAEKSVSESGVVISQPPALPSASASLRRDEQRGEPPIPKIEPPTPAAPMGESLPAKQIPTFTDVLDLSDNK